MVRSSRIPCIRYISGLYVLALASVTIFVGLANPATSQAEPFTTSAQVRVGTTSTTLTWNLDTDDADFSWQEGEYNYWAYRDIGVFAESITGGWISMRWSTSRYQLDGSSPWLFDRNQPYSSVPPDRCATPVIASKRVKVKNYRVNCTAAVNVVRHFLTKKKNPPGWKCSTAKAKTACKRTSDGSTGSGITLPSAERQQYEQAVSKSVQRCGAAITPMVLQADVMGITPGSCELVNEDSIIMYVAKLTLTGEWPEPPAGFTSCTGRVWGYNWCEDDAGHCIVITTDSNVNWYDTYFFGQGYGFTYRSLDYAGC